MRVVCILNLGIHSRAWLATSAFSMNRRAGHPARGSIRRAQITNPADPGCSWRAVPAGTDAVGMLRSRSESGPRSWPEQATNRHNGGPIAHATCDDEAGSRRPLRPGPGSELGRCLVKPARGHDRKWRRFGRSKWIAIAGRSGDASGFHILALTGGHRPPRIGPRVAFAKGAPLDHGWGGRLVWRNGTLLGRINSWREWGL